MTGRHAASDEVDDQALADRPYEPGAHAAPADSNDAPLNGTDPQGAIGDGSVPADADLQAEAPAAPRTGRRAKGAS